MIYPVSLHTGVKSKFAFMSKNAKQKPFEVPAKSPVKEVPANNTLSYNIKLIK